MNILLAITQILGGIFLIFYRIVIIVKYRISWPNWKFWIDIVFAFLAGILIADGIKLLK